MADTKTFFTSDLHFGHNKDFLYKPRGFDNIEEHDDTVIENWNSVVSKDDTVYVYIKSKPSDNKSIVEIMELVDSILPNSKIYIKYI